ncbi:TolC family protein, partial [candidate division KSB1 bacterium]|nr:TolC family protein [candidate division KSB1 bacterium]
FPQIVVTLGYTRYNEPNIIVPIHERGVFPPLDNEIYETATQLKIPLFSGGRRLATTREAEASATESAEQEKTTEMRLMESIARIYIQSQELADKKALIIARLTMLRQRRTELLLLQQAGRVSSADVALVNSSIEATRSDSLGIESRFYELAVRLGQLLGRNEPVQPLRLARDGVGDEMLPDSLESPAEIAGPEVRKAQAELERAEALHAQAQRSFWPEISGFASYFLKSGGDLDMTGEWAIGISISLPIFDGGRRIANIRVAKASRKAAEENAHSALHAQNAALEIAMERWRISNYRQEHITQAVKSKSRSVRAQRKMYEAGRLALSELLNQETELLQLQMDERGLAYAGRLAIMNYHATAGTLTAELAEKIVGSTYEN